MSLYILLIITYTLTFGPSDKPFFHVMTEYFGGEVYEIHAEINIDEVELDE
jgi:hypothetical protein